MATLLLVLGALLYLGSLVGAIFILVEAFRDEVWKGFACLFLCGLYTLYYAFVEFDHEYKWPILGAWLGGGFLGSLLVKTAEGMLPQ